MGGNNVEKKKREVKGISFTKKMVISLVGGLIVGLGFLFLREHLIRSNQGAVWQTINQILFQDISDPEKGQSAIGLFYIIGQLFINGLQLVIVPMVFTSITLAICHITDTQKLGRISYKTIFGFLSMSLIALLTAGIVGYSVYLTGAFNVSLSETLAPVEVSTSGNPLMVIVNAVTKNIGSAFSDNGAILAVVVLAVITGLCINALGDKIRVFKKLIEEVNAMVTLFLTFVITKFAPIAVFMLLVRTFASYGIDYLKPALVYVVTTTATLLAFLMIGYPLFILFATKLNPVPFIKKIMKVVVFGFSTSSSAATLPLNTKTTVEELGVDSDVAAFVLPLGMTINMNGTAIMQVIAAIFVAGVAGYEVTPANIALIAILALMSSIGTPAAPGAGGIILFTILTGLNYNNEIAIVTYSLILAINRPIEMLVTSLNVVGDSATAIYVAHSEDLLDEATYLTDVADLQNAEAE
ncbi:dicarboxylate/amino acid:cation symporter [Enterococcus faecalis]|uniref:dicarboxylate/amino acid:cation symporter n=1 Tax=Enterococcus faecalis TaxID=1351 RepID=UPI0022E0536A|nr:dicarboxylate/amino acid:cation symporter [Enterococcus faecalis]